MAAKRKLVLEKSDTMRLIAGDVRFASSIDCIGSHQL